MITLRGWEKKQLVSWIGADASGRVTAGHCNCMASLEEICSHVASLLVLGWEMQWLLYKRRPTGFYTTFSKESAVWSIELHQDCRKKSGSLALALKISAKPLQPCSSYLSLPLLLLTLFSLPLHCIPLYHHLEGYLHALISISISITMHFSITCHFETCNPGPPPSPLL